MERINGADWVDIGGGRRGFRSQNAIAGVPGTEVTDTFLNSIQEELASFIEATGEQLNAADSGQAARAVQSGRLMYAVAAGTADALTVTLKPAPKSYGDGMLVHVRFAATNTATAPTLNVNGLGAKIVVNADGSPLLPGTLVKGARGLFAFDQALNKFALLACGAGSGASSSTAWQPVASMTLTAPPASPTPGIAYLIPANAVGAWAGHTGDIAEWTGAAWSFVTPPDGHAVSLPDGSLYRKIGGSYVLAVATDSRSGFVELATVAEVQAGTDVERAVTPAGLSGRTATETRTGLVELATTAEAKAGTDTARAVTSAGLAAAIADAIAKLVNSAPGALDQLNELAAALGNDANFAATMTNALATKLARDQNLADLPDKAVARANLGANNASNLTTGTLPNGRLAGAYSGITDFSITGQFTVTNGSPILRLQDTTASAYDARFRLDANNVYIDGSADGVTYAEVLRFEMDTKAGYMNQLILGSGGEAIRLNAPTAGQDPYISWCVAGVRQGYIQSSDGTSAANGITIQNDVATGGATRLALRNTGGVGGLGYRVGTADYTVWHSGNLVGGETASTPNTLAQRDGSGDVNARLFRSEYDSTNASIGFIMTQVDTANNNYIRPSTPAQVAAVLNGLVGVGAGQSWQNVAASRAANTVYQNTTGRPILVAIMQSGDGNNVYVSNDNANWIAVGCGSGNSGEKNTTTIVVPNGHYYQANGFQRWSELR